MLRHGLVRGIRALWSAEVEWCMYISKTRVYEERDRERERGSFFYLSAFRGAKGGCEGPWHRLACLTDWKQGFIFSNLWSRRWERSVKRRRGEGVLGETLGGEMKDIFQDKLSSADVDGRCLANRNKWDCFDLNLTCIRKPSSVLHSLFFLSFFISYFDQIHQPISLHKWKKDVLGFKK